MTLYLKDALFVDWKTLEVRTTHLAVDPGGGDELSFPGAVPAAGALAPGDRILDCRGKLVTRSFGCGHHHIYSALARGMPAPAKTPSNFLEILKYVWWRLDKRLDLDMIEASALAAALHCAKNGVTFIIDHHASPMAVEGSLTRIAEAFDRVGVAHMLCYEISDRDGDGPRDAGLEETDRFLGSGRQGHVGLHASFTVSPELLDRAVELAHRHHTGLHLHVAEDQADQKRTEAAYGRRAVERLYEAGALELPTSILAHCLHLSAREKELVRRSGVWTAQNTESNQNNNVGLTGYASWTDNVILGTDGMHGDMLRAAKAVFLAGQAAEGLGFDQVYRRFRDIHRYLADAGARGDGADNLVILDYDSPTEIHSGNFLGHFVFGLEARHVETVIAGGKIIVENRRATRVDETEILAFAREMANKLWARMEEETS